MNNKYTFWQLLNENTIEIPIIQRDYAQGRTTIKETKIRDRFLDTLYTKIQDEHDSINLDFVYGKIEHKKLIPLDGQQRLTTLFLLHWYLASKENKLEECRNILKNFTYETRVSSREFCNALVSNTIELEREIEIIENDKVIIKTLKTSEIIEDNNWFFQSWKKDPTIQSMLSMIDTIHIKFKNSKGLFDKLTCNENPPITFDFLPLNEFKLTDELYVKMNARGKALTDFEDFKAKFIELLSDEDASKLDNSWTDLFWKHRVKGKNDEYFYIDEKFLNYFTNLTVNFAILNSNIDTKKKLDKVNIMEIYESVYQDSYVLQNLIELTDKLVKLNQINQLNKDNFDYFIEKNDLSYWDRAKFFAFSKFFLYTHGIDTESEAFIQWTRVTNNIIYNYNIDSVDKFKNVLKLIELLSKNIHNLNDFIASNNFIKEKTESFKTLEFQKYEEHRKAKLQKNIEWQKAIEVAEKHEYLNGHISFLIDIANEDIDLFNKYFNKFNSDFIEDKENFLFQRALLTKGDYTVLQGLNYSFCSFDKSPRGKDDNWKMVFNDDKLKNYLKELLDDDRPLDKIINESKVDDWREGFIKFPKLLKYCKKYKIRWYDENDILLLSGERVYGQHAEYNTYFLYSELIRLYGEEYFKYIYSNSTNEDKYIKFNKNKIVFKDKKWYFNNDIISCREKLLDLVSQEFNNATV
jgi:hypothetical protein